MTVSNREHVIDSREVIERINELEAERADLVENVEDTHNIMLSEDEVQDDMKDVYDDALQELRDWDRSEDAAELKALKDLAEEASGYSPDWVHGEALIHESYWEDYVKDMLQDIGDLPKDIPWYIVIDWEETAKNISMDYTTVDYAGETYYIRNG